jgi:hypothetical protein
MTNDEYVEKCEPLTDGQTGEGTRRADRLSLLLVGRRCLRHGNAAMRPTLADRTRLWLGARWLGRRNDNACPTYFEIVEHVIAPIELYFEVHGRGLISSQFFHMSRFPVASTSLH